MREILFKAKRADNGELVTGYYTKSIVNGSVFGYIRESIFGTDIKIMLNTLCQYTGLKDKNGNKIWENDIVEAWIQERCAIGKIKHRIDGTWIMYPAWQSGEMWYLLPNDDGITTVEVIGNSFDNSELIHE